MAEGMRDYLKAKGIENIYSSLGASDLELNIAAENDFTISFRRLLRDNVHLQERVLAHRGALPMVFQFNPADFLIETSPAGELIISVCRPDYIAPKIRYNIHDKGHVLQMDELFGILKELNIDVANITKPKTDLPILLHYGRADMTVAFFGANISPVDIQEALYEIPELAALVNSFRLNICEDSEGTKQLIVAFELQEHHHLSTIEALRITPIFLERLIAVNQDFREAKKMLLNDTQAQINFYDFSEGPFNNSDIRIKANYVPKA